MKYLCSNFNKVQILLLGFVGGVVFLMLWEGGTSSQRYPEQYSPEGYFQMVSADSASIAKIRETLVPPSPRSVPYQLSKPEAVHFEQHEDDGQFLEMVFGSILDGFFIEVGAYNGETFSNSLWLERNRNWTGLLIETDKINFDSIVGKKRKAWVHNSCLSRKSIPEIVNFPADHSAGKGIYIYDTVKFEPKSDLEMRDQSKLTEAQQCYPLHYYLLALNRTRVDFFSLDVEGMDLEVLKTIPFDKFDFRLIMIETGGGVGNTNIKPYMESIGFVPVKRNKLNTFFVPFIRRFNLCFLNQETKT